MKRNGYIDIIKFIFAIIIVGFHVNANLFQGGRIAVEGFFMINGYLMLSSLDREKNKESSLAGSTVNFLWRKYKSLFYFLLPSVIIGFVVFSLYYEYSFTQAIGRAPLLIFDIIPLYCVGLRGQHVVGISWYLSAMFIALAVLYPLARKFRKSFTTIACPLIVLLGYGTLAYFFKHLAVNEQYIEGTIINSGLVRGLAGCALGCVMYELSKLISNKTPTVFTRVACTVMEVGAFCGFYYLMHEHSKSIYEYINIILIFIFMFIGINGLSYTSYLWNPKWTKPFGVISTLLVLNHVCWSYYLRKLIGQGFQHTKDVLWYILAVALSCVAVYLASLLLRWITKSLSKIKLWKEQK